MSWLDYYGILPSRKKIKYRLLTTCIIKSYITDTNVNWLAIFFKVSYILNYKQTWDIFLCYKNWLNMWWFQWFQ